LGKQHHNLKGLEKIVGGPKKGVTPQEKTFKKRKLRNNPQRALNTFTVKEGTNPERLKTKRVFL